MTTRISADIHFGPDDLRHKYHAADERCHAYGVLKITSGDTTGANLYFDNAAHVDAVIAELVALRNEMEPYAPPANPPFFASDGEGECGATDQGWICTSQAGHDGPDHIAWHVEDDGDYHRWPAVITDSERTCDAVNPDGSGEHCHRGGDHGVHQDSNGDEWRTDLVPRYPSGRCLDEYLHLGNADYCQRDEGHDGQHRGRNNRRWNAEPASVITDSARTCQAKHPDTNDWCVVEDMHTEHRDHNGGTWRTLSPHCKHCDPAHCDGTGRGHVTACQTPGCPSAQQLAVAS